MIKKTIFVIAILLLVVVNGCNASESPPFTEVRPASIGPGDPIPVPTEEVILTIAGDIKTTNVGDTLQLDMPTLERLRLVEYTVEDPYRAAVDDPSRPEKVTYTGVLMEDLMEFLRITESSEKFHIVALDDYRVDLSFEDIDKWPILLATRSNGEYMDVANSGPTRIIFPYHAFKIDPVKYNDLWIWNIDTMQVD